ncbi:MAG: 16S rRNA (guanine(527)-N(7))-methyltransferase RsmG [Oscillospiraceae bacterium]|nr:16S rRNA (guanine(527)-N(7))-methyltransferase RsmG [Oscillospiraceae bacterium]
MQTLLRDGLTALHLPPDAAEPMRQYAEMLLERNRVMNLTAITSESDVAQLHFLDSCALTMFADFHGKSVIDVGTGAGFPGLPLRLVEPSLKLTLLDAQRKRVDFLREVRDALKLSGVDCVQERAEVYAAQNRERFDIAVSRAVAALPVLAELCLPLVRVGGAFLAMKSVNCDAELSSASHAVRTLGGHVQQVSDYTIPGSDIPRRVIVIEKRHHTPSGYPRAFGKIKKNPL